MVHHIICGLPDSTTWPHFKQLMIQTMQDHITCKMGQIIPSLPDTLLNLIISRLTIECQWLESQKIKLKLNLISEYSNYSAEGNNRGIAKHANNPKGVCCTNCGGRSYDIEHCFHEGGSMAGQGPHGSNYKKPTKPLSSLTKEHAHTSTSQADTILASIDVDEGELSCTSLEPTDKSVLISLALNNWSTLLDSGATSHLIKSCELFWTYNTTATRDVKTANLSILKTHAHGDCVVIFKYNGIATRINLCNCLHATDTIINLLSVRCFVTAGISHLFQEGKVLLSVPTKTFGHGPMVNRLFILDVEYIKLPDSLPPSLSSELACFAKVPETLDLWHYHLGYVGEPATIRLLWSTLGASIPKGDRLSQCEPCIFGKQAQSPAPTSSTPRTTDLLELIHIDICGLFPVATPHGKLYFALFLDDASSMCNLQNLTDRTQVL